MEINNKYSTDSSTVGSGGENIVDREAPAGAQVRYRVDCSRDGGVGGCADPRGWSHLLATHSQTKSIRSSNDT